MYTIVLAGGALEAKTARESSHRLFLKGAWSGQIANRTSNGATRATKSDKYCFYLGHLGVEKVDFLMDNARSRFAKTCFPLQRGAFFGKKWLERLCWKKKSRNGGKDCMQSSHPKGAIAARSAIASKFWTPQGRAQGDFTPQSCTFSAVLGSQKKPFSNFCIKAPFATMLRTRTASTFL